MIFALTVLVVPLPQVDHGVSIKPQQELVVGDGGWCYHNLQMQYS